MTAQIIHDQDVAVPKFASQRLSGIAGEDIAVHRAIQHHRRNDAIEPQAGDEGHGFPMAIGRFSAQALALAASAMGTRHVGLRLPLR